MNRIKTESRNRLGQEKMETQMRVGEGVGIVEFNPDPSINIWFQEKIRRLGRAKPQKYSKRRNVASASASEYTVIDIASVKLSDLKSSDDEFNEFDISDI